MAESGNLKPTADRSKPDPVKTDVSSADFYKNDTDRTKTDTSTKASDNVQDALKSGGDVSGLYNSLSADDQRKVFQDLKKASTDAKTGLNNLVVTGIDTDGDGKEDKLADIYDSNTGKDLYNKPGEQANSNDALKGRNAEISKREEALFKQLNPNDKFLTEAELKAGIDSGSLKGFDANTAKMWQNFREKVQGFNDDEMGRETTGITRDDIKHPEYQRFRELAGRPDVAKMFDSYQKSVQTMVEKGERESGSGSINAMWNNAQAKFGSSSEKLQCYEQAERVLQGLGNAKLEGKWDMHLIGELNAVGAVAMAVGGESPGHYKVEMVPHDPKDPVVVIDPWKNTFDIKDPKTFKPSGATFYWTDGQGNAGMGDHRERQDRTDRQNLFEEWRRGDRATKFDKWVNENHPDKKHILDVNAPRSSKKDYGFTDYAKERWDRL